MFEVREQFWLSFYPEEKQNLEVQADEIDYKHSLFMTNFMCKFVFLFYVFTLACSCILNFCMCE